MRVASAAIVSLVVAGVVTAPASADLIELKNGGKLYGNITNAGDRAAANHEIATDSGGKISIPRDQVSRIVPLTEAQEEYQRRARVVADTADAHWQLADWCRQQKLVLEYRDELARVLELDPNHERAHLALGHKKHGGGWSSRDEVMAARGLIWYDGKYYSQQHIELLEQAKAVKKTDADWRNQLERWRRWLTGRRKDRSDEALREIRALKNPAAAPALVALLDEEQDPEVRRLLIDVAAPMETPEVVEKLVQMSLQDPDDDLRYAALQDLIATGRPGLIGPYVHVLRSNDNVLVNRAAEALGQIGNRDAIGPLINAVVTRHKTKIAGGNPNQHAYTFTPSGGTAMNFGSAPPKDIVQEVENPAVLAALSKLAGANFGFDKAAWHNWLTSDAKAHPVNIRRDP
ncbi:MAG: HEAT repeat domain-containing protein [Pirellulales bacterium]